MLHFTCKTFDELSSRELYEIMTLRLEVFAVEQQCVYQDADGLDPDCRHLMGRDEDGTLLAYTRLLPPGLAYPGYASIGRVVTAPDARNKGLGRPLMQTSIDWVNQLWQEPPIKIGAQFYLRKFYASMGFESTGEIYLEDLILHLKMVRYPKNNDHFSRF